MVRLAQISWIASHDDRASGSICVTPSENQSGMKADEAPSSSNSNMARDPSMPTGKPVSQQPALEANPRRHGTRNRPPTCFWTTWKREAAGWPKEHSLGTAKCARLMYEWNIHFVRLNCLLFDEFKDHLVDVASRRPYHHFLSFVWTNIWTCFHLLHANIMDVKVCHICLIYIVMHLDDYDRARKACQMF